VSRKARSIAQALHSLEAAEVALPSVQTPITGVTILDCAPERLADLQHAMPDHDIVEDVPITVVPPTRTGNVAADPVDVDTWHLEAVQLVRARRAGFDGTGQGVGVAILDTGVQEVHEIRDRVKSAYEIDPVTGTARVIKTHDTEGHGTHVAGLIAGATVGVAPGAELMNVIMIPNGFGRLSDYIFAMEFVATQPEISVMNMSAGRRGFHAGMEAALDALLAVGVLPVVAIGNEGANTSRSPGNYAQVLSVGASTKQDRIAGFSGGGTMVVNNQSYTIPDLVAPGQAVMSCVMGGGYEALKGTSMATPIVSGLAALIIEDKPDHHRTGPARGTARSSSGSSGHLRTPARRRACAVATASMAGCELTARRIVTMTLTSEAD